jgi:beta-lactamase superfamily II metal-dependent hydrolase
MKIHIFQSQKGDCLLLSSDDGRHLLADGGMAASMKEHVRAKLPGLVGKGGAIDYAYISHIDQDHISGVLALLKDMLEWRVHDFHKKNGDTGIKAPDFPRPPEIKSILHNAFRDQVTKNKGEIADLLAASGRTFLGTSNARFQAAGLELAGIAQSVAEALEVSSLASAKLLDIPVNSIAGPAKGKLIYIRDEPIRFKLGTARVTVVGPTEAELTLLRKGWNNWLKRSGEAVRKLREKQKERIDQFSENALAGNPFDLREWEGIPDYKGVTAPNIASLMLMVEEGGRSVLLTGDSQQEFILGGLEKTGYLAGGSLHLDVLKVQHHGSEHNTDVEFCRKVSADHYVFCGNGENGNPELSVIQQYYDSRLGPPARRALSPRAQDRKFQFWFSTTSKMLREGSDERAVFEKVEKLVAALEKKSGGKLVANFNSKAYRTLDLVGPAGDVTMATISVAPVKTAAKKAGSLIAGAAKIPAKKAARRSAASKASRKRAPSRRTAGAVRKSAGKRKQ